MSKHNKANKNNYNQAGRLTPDELARERVKQGEISRGRTEERMTGRLREERSTGRTEAGADERVSGKRDSSGEQESSRPRSEREEAE